jgi:hypothetical protein
LQVQDYVWDHESMAKEHLSYGGWALRVLAWDAALPLCVALLPMGVELLFPNHRPAIELTAVVLPIAAFPLRAWAGLHHIMHNNSSFRLRILQLCAFCLGILPLALLDSVLILSHLMPVRAFANGGGRTALVLAAILYVSLMTLSMYPGRTEIPRADPADLLAYGGGRTNEGQRET